MIDRARVTPLAVRLLAAFVAALLVSGCGGASTGAGGGVAIVTPGGVRTLPAAEGVKAIESRTVIDVRSPAEFAAGHVAGAQNIDVEAGDFEQRIAALDRQAPYLLYCRSGRRSAIAAGIMADMGFTDVIDAGGLEDLAAAGAGIE